MNKLEWNKKFELGVKQIDKQHRRLVDLINEVDKILTANQSRADAEKVLLSLQEYTLKHFSAEEALMQSSGYRDLQRHQLLHQQIREQLAKYIDAYNRRDDQVIPELLTFLQTWLAAHVMGTDQKIAPFLPK